MRAPESLDYESGSIGQINALLKSVGPCSSRLAQ